MKRSNLGTHVELLPDRRRGLLSASSPYRWPVVSFAMAAAVVLAAFSISSKAGASTPSSGSPIALGVMGSFSGSQAQAAGPAEPAIKAWADSVNASGGIRGHKIKLFVDDDAGVASNALTDVRQLVTQDKIVAIVDDWSTVDADWGPYLAQQGIPIIGGFDGNGFATNPDFFNDSTTVNSLLYDQFELGHKVGGTRLAYVYCSEVAACATEVPISAVAAKDVDSKLVWSGKESSTAPSYAAPCLAAKAAGANEMYAAFAPATTSNLVTDCAQEGYKPRIVEQGGAVDSSFLSVPAMNGMVATEENAPWFDTSIPAVAKLRAVITKYFPTAQANFAAASVNGWASGELFEAAYKAAGSPSTLTSKDLVKGLYDLHGVTLGGLTPPLTYAKGKSTIVTCAYAIEISGGKFTTPFGPNASVCAPRNFGE